MVIGSERWCCGGAAGTDEYIGEKIFNVGAVWWCEQAVMMAVVVNL